MMLKTKRLLEKINEYEVRHLKLKYYKNRKRLAIILGITALVLFLVMIHFASVLDPVSDAQQYHPIVTTLFLLVVGLYVSAMYLVITMDSVVYKLVEDVNDNGLVEYNYIERGYKGRKSTQSFPSLDQADTDIEAYLSKVEIPEDIE